MKKLLIFYWMVAKNITRKRKRKQKSIEIIIKKKGVIN